ncbi:FCS-Like Zinc finger 6 [Macadamia integrifolia]|uniref:FCS-Like Zinc finger 6 n=1 Tax=Macadamia integrifolia TaxID=60698 RepID=UPI001C4EC5B1|nr:FCS-Like Zinc finger 6 [Macadamia integrifolia]
MLLGKRPRRPSLRRTTSLTEFTLDLSGLEENPATSDAGAGQNVMKERQKAVVQEGSAARKNQPGFGGGFEPTDGFDYRLMATMSPRTTTRRNLGDLLETSHFLKTCSLCKRRLVPGRDIYMYRGDTAFCSLECRQKQMNKDETKEEKCAVASKKDAPNTGGSESSPNKGETVAAA